MSVMCRSTTSQTKSVSDSHSSEAFIVVQSTVQMKSVKSSCVKNEKEEPERERLCSTLSLETGCQMALNMF